MGFEMAERTEYVLRAGGQQRAFDKQTIDDLRDMEVIRFHSSERILGGTRYVYYPIDRRFR